MGNGAQDPALATQAAVQVRVESERSDGAPVVGRRLVALQVGDRYVRSQRVQGDLRIPMKRLERLGFLESGVTLHSHDNLGGQSRTSMRAIAGRLYLFQSS